MSIGEHLQAPEHLDADGIEPELPELLQEVYPGPAVPIRPVGPITVNELPTRDASSRNLTVSDTTEPPEMIANEDPRRKFLTIVVTGQPCYVGFDKASVRAGTAGIVPTGVPISLPASLPVYVKAASAGNAVVSYWAGTWAD